MPRVYLDTSFLSACVGTRQDAASVYRRDTSNDWLRTQAGSHHVFVSAEVERELSDASYKSRDDALRLLRGFEYLDIDDQVAGLALVFVRERLMPGPATGDALRVATAAVHGVDFLLSWNVRHLANPNKTRHLQIICVRTGYTPPRIVTPELLWEPDR